MLDWPRGARPTPRAPPRRYASLFESDAARALEGAPAHALLDRVAAVEAGSPAWLFFTSGTTGRPKAAVLSHENLREQSRAFLTDLHAVRPEEVGQLQMGTASLMDRSKSIKTELMSLFEKCLLPISNEVWVSTLYS